jgi:hypothetical protein
MLLSGQLANALMTDSKGGVTDTAVTALHALALILVQ